MSIVIMTQCSTSMDLPYNYSSVERNNLYKEHRICLMSFRILQNTDTLSLSIQGITVFKDIQPQDLTFEPTEVCCADSNYFDYDLVLVNPHHSRKTLIYFMTDPSKVIITKIKHPKDNTLEYVLSINSKTLQGKIDFDDTKHLIHDYCKNEDTILYRKYNGLYLYD